MQRIEYALDISPKYGEEFARAGIRTVADLAKVESLQELSLRTSIPVELLQQWREQAKQKIKASRYRRRAATAITIVTLALGSVPIPVEK